MIVLWQTRRRVWLAWVLVWATALLVACDTMPAGAPTPTVVSQASPTAVTNSAGGAGSVVFRQAPVVVTSEEMSPPAGEAITAKSTGVVEDLTAGPDALATLTALDGASSRGKIAAAEGAGKIDRDTALVYKLLAEHDPDALPPELRGDDSLAGMRENTDVLLELASRRGSLSPELQAQADAFFERPTELASFWRERLEAPEDDAIDFEFLDAGERVRFWYDGAAGEEVAGLAARLVEEVTGTGMWEAEKSAMLGREPCSDAHLRSNGGDGRVDMYLMPPGSIYPRRSMSPPAPFQAAGLTVPQSTGRGCPYVVFILLDQTLEYDYLRSALAHELFHAFQFSYEQQIDEAYYWWMEASATWVEDLIYPTLNEEWQMLRASHWTNHDGPNGPLDLFEEGGYAQYGAYIWPFFLMNGPSAEPPTLVGEIFEAGEKQETPLEAMAGREGWREQFKQFALWNWNRFPARFYSDHGEPISVLSQRPVPIELELTGGTSTAEVNLRHSSIRYYSMRFEEGAGSPGFVSVDMSSITKQAGADVQAIIVTEDGDEPAGYLEDWSGLGKRNLCFRASATPREIVLVVSNSGIGSSVLKGSINVQARRQGCPALPPGFVTGATPTPSPGGDE